MFDVGGCFQCGLAHEFQIRTVGHAERDVNVSIHIAHGPVHYVPVHELGIRNDHVDVVVGGDHFAFEIIESRFQREQLLCVTVRHDAA